MNEKKLVSELVSNLKEVPSEVDVIRLREPSVDETRSRLKRLLAIVGGRERRSVDRGDWTERSGRTVVHLTEGARAVAYHASGALRFSSGIPPLERLFENIPEKDALQKLLHEAARNLALESWAGNGESLHFERLWQIKAQGADRDNKLSRPLLCRVVGAYRHHVAGIPVLGAASVAVKLAANGTLDSLSIAMRSSTSEIIDKARIHSPEQAARQVVVELHSLLGNAKSALPSDVVESQRMQFGYVSLGKRATQRVLAPAYVAEVVLRHEHERQAYVIAVPATERSYLALAPCRREAPTALQRDALKVAS